MKKKKNNDYFFLLIILPILGGIVYLYSKHPDMVHLVIAYVIMLGAWYYGLFVLPDDFYFERKKNANYLSFLVNLCLFAIWCFWLFSGWKNLIKDYSTNGLHLMILFTLGFSGVLIGFLLRRIKIKKANQRASANSFQSSAEAGTFKERK